MTYPILQFITKYSKYLLLIYYKSIGLEGRLFSSLPVLSVHSVNNCHLSTFISVLSSVNWCYRDSFSRSFYSRIISGLYYYISKR